MGVVEQKHHHILDTAHALLISSSVPPSFWAEVVLTSANLINITSSSVLARKSPHEHIYSFPLDYSMFRTFRCTCYVLLPPTERTKLSSWSAKCVLSGISSEHKGYHCYDLLARRLLIFRHVFFIEVSPYFSFSSQDVHFLSPPDTPSVESSRVPIDLIPLESVVSIPPTDHFGTVLAATIPTSTLGHEDPPVTTPTPTPPSHPPSLLLPTSPPPPPHRSDAPISHLLVLPLVVLVFLINLVLLVLYPFHYSFGRFLPSYIVLVGPVLTERRFNTSSGERPWKRNFGQFSRLVLGVLFLIRRVLYLWVANRSSRSNTDLMVPLNGTRLSFLPEDLLKSMRLITMRLLHMLLR